MLLFFHVSAAIASLNFLCSIHNDPFDTSSVMCHSRIQKWKLKLQRMAGECGPLFLKFAQIFPTERCDTYQNYFANKCTFLLKHKMLQFVFKISPYMAPTCFGPFGPSSGII